MKALPEREVASLAPSDIEEPTEATPAQSEPAQPQEPLAHKDAGEHELVEGTVLPPATRDREAAIQAGTLIDVTPTAQQLGITFPVTITRPLWEAGIVTNQSLPEKEQTNRLRDT